MVLQSKKDKANRYLIQMEEERNLLQWEMEDNEGITQIISANRHAIIQDQISSTILQLIALNRPIFKVLSTTDTINTELMQQELIKRKILSYNRKDKSLEELSKKFISNFEGKDGIILELDKVTIQLKVERRRIYDIVNIFQSLNVVKKAAKNNYIWRGLKQAIKTIGLIQQNGSDFSPPTAKKQKSLESLSSRFLQLFVYSKHPLSLQESAKYLIQNEDSALVKTKIRRLYDIVNVFKSIGIVEKVHLTSNKPAFKWVGTKNLEKIIEEQKSKHKQIIDARTVCVLQKQNSLSMFNKQNIKEMKVQEDKYALIELSFKKRFSQKMFEPEIIRQQTMSYSLVTTQQNLNDLCAQY